MNIQKLSINIDQQLQKLDNKLQTLRERQKSEGNSEQIEKDLAALEQMRNKLVKSRDIMWQAHRLQQESDQHSLQQKRWLGLGLIIFSGLGLLALGLFVLLR